MSLEKKYSYQSYSLYSTIRWYLPTGTHSIDGDHLIDLFYKVDESFKKEILEILIIGDNLKLFKECSEYVLFDIKYDDSKLLQIASYNGSMESMKYLLEKGFDVHSQNDYPIRAVLGFQLELLYKKENIREMFNLLVDYGADVHINNDELLYSACIHENKKIIKSLIDMNLNVNSRGSEILETVVNSGDTDLVSMILDAGANPSDRFSIRLASIMCDIDILKLLINSGGNIEVLQRDDLIEIIQKSDFTTIKLLADMGVDFSIINDYEPSNKSFHQIISLLESFGVDPIVTANILYDKEEIN